jgi:hypothetical protein
MMCLGRRGIPRRGCRSTGIVHWQFEAASGRMFQTTLTASLATWICPSCASSTSVRSCTTPSLGACSPQTRLCALQLTPRTSTATGGCGFCVPLHVTARKALLLLLATQLRDEQPAGAHRPLWVQLSLARVARHHSRVPLRWPVHLGHRADRGAHAGDSESAGADALGGARQLYSRLSGLVSGTSNPFHCWFCVCVDVPLFASCGRCSSAPALTRSIRSWRVAAGATHSRLPAWTSRRTAKAVR